jgi:cytidylate kinase
VKNIITISGKSGCGNSTISKLIAEKFGYEHINLTLRQIAEEQGITFENLLNEAQSDSRFDYELDKRQKALAQKGHTVLGSRLAIWLLKEEAITVYLDANIDKRVSNIKKREPEKSEKEIREFTAQRDVADHQKVLKIIPDK